MKITKIFFFFIGISVCIFGIVYLSFSSEETSYRTEEGASTIWTCAMHPHIQLNQPGNCPICGMKLIPLIFDENEENLSAIKLSERARKLAEVETVAVKRGEARIEISLYGRLDFDESRVAHITSRTPGRIERTFLDFTGVSVKRGDHMVDLYSPDLITAQEELIQAVQAFKSLREDASDFLKQSFKDNLSSSQKKLLLWGLSEEQIDKISKNGETEEVITINAPISGVVLHKEAVEGKYVKEGSRIYTIADLSQLWLILDAYESDLNWIRYGQELSFEVDAIPGKTFKGIISFIDPVLNEKKRVVRVRSNVENPNGSLKPGMFARAKVKPLIGKRGSVLSKSLEGKWICFMHPQIVQDKEGNCPVCDMELLTADSLGYALSTSEDGELPLLIPATAPLITGKRAIVFVEDPEELGLYTAKTVVLGPRAGDFYIIYDGLEEGEKVVKNGNFKIDSASQILAKPSMMMPEGSKQVIKRHDH